MKRPTHIRKRDGRVVPFDEGKIADAIYRAALAVGGEDRFLAEELAGLVTLFLAKTLGAEAAGAGDGGADLPGFAGAAPPPGAPAAVPGIEQVQDTVERVLVETGHARTARAYIQHRERRARLREAAAARAAEVPPTLFDDRLLLVDDPAFERSAPFSADRLARSVAAETGLPASDAAGVVRSVEERLRRARIRRLPAPLLHSLVDGELLDRGLLRDPRARSGASLPRAAIDAALHPKGRAGAALPPEEAARRLGGEALRSHALASEFPAEVAAAHLEGTLHVHGLSRPAALFAATLSPDALKSEGVPGAAGRAPGSASADSRRFVAQLGRAAGALAGFTTHGVGVAGASLLLAPLVAGPDRDLDRDAALEEAWHLLHACASGPGGGPPELDLAAGVPQRCAGAPARGAGGRPTGAPLGAYADAARTLARAVVAQRAAAEGLPPRACLPAISLVVDRASLGDPGARTLLRETLAAALRGLPLSVVLERDGEALVGPGRARERLEGLEAADPAAWRPFRVQKVTLNLPRAAFRAPPGDLGAFFRECDRAVDLAMEAHRARRSLVASVAGAEGGALAPLFRRPRTAPGKGGEPRGAPAPFGDPGRGVFAVGIVGLNEAVAHLLGEEIHEGDAAPKVASRVLAYLDLKVREAGRAAEMPVHLVATDEGRVPGRFATLDRAEFRAEQRRAGGEREAYSPGVSVRPGAPADLLLRLDREGRLHEHLGVAAFRFDPATDPGVSEEGLLALLEKAYLHTPVRLVAFGGEAARGS